MITRRLFLSMSAMAAYAKSGWPLGACTAIDGVSLLESIRTIKEVGLPAIEIQPMGEPEARRGKFPGFAFERLSGEQRKSIREALRGFQQVTAHLPYTGLNYMAPDAQAREKSIRTVEIAMDGSAHFGAQLAVLHPQPLSEDELRSGWTEYLDRFRVWGDRAKKLGFRIALETGYPRSVKEYVRLIREIGHENVGSTIDVGHQRAYAELVARVKPEDKGTVEGIRAYNDTTLAIVEQLGKKVFHFHVHDIEPATWAEHKPLVHGFVDYPRLFAKLREVGYGGILIFEIGGPGGELPGHLRDGKRKLLGWM